MPDVIPEERIRAAYRARACAAGIACGAQIFSVGAGLLIPVCLNAAYLAALPALIPCAITAFCARRHLASGKSAGRQPIGKALLILLSLMLLFCCASLLCAAVVFTQQTLLPQAHLTTCLMLTLGAAFLCALPTGTGVSRVAFALRFLLPGALILFSVLSLSSDSPSGLFPLLGSGVKPLTLGMLCGLSACSPVLMLLLPPEELTDEYAPPAAVPGAAFFIGRVLLGGLVGVLMLLALSLCGTYELLSEQSVWGARMMILSSSRPREGIIQTLLVIAQLFALLIGAVSLLCAAAQSLKAAFPRMRLSLPLCALALLASLLLSAAFGTEWLLHASPFLLIPLGIFMLLSGRM